MIGKKKEKRENLTLSFRINKADYDRLQLILAIKEFKRGELSNLLQKALSKVLDEETAGLSKRIKEILGF